MNLHSIINTIVCGVCLICTISLNAQTDAIKTNDTVVNSKQRNVAYSLAYHNPMPSGDNFIGKGLEGNGGFNFKIQVYVYKQLFIGGSLGASYFNVTDPKILGDYKKTRLAEQYLFVGYEFVPTDDFRIGISASVLGDSRYKNQKADDVYQKDSARLNSYGVYLSYEISSQFMVFVDYAYRVDKTNINVPTSLEDTFRKGTFNQIGIGLKVSFKGKDLVSSF